MLCFSYKQRKSLLLTGWDQVRDGSRRSTVSRLAISQGIQGGLISRPTVRGMGRLSMDGTSLLQGAIPVSWSSSLRQTPVVRVRYVASSQFYSIRCVHKLQVLGTWRGQQGKLKIFQMLPDYFLADGTRHSFSCCGEMFGIEMWKQLTEAESLVRQSFLQEGSSRRGLPCNTHDMHHAVCWDEAGGQTLHESGRCGPH